MKLSRWEEAFERFLKKNRRHRAAIERGIRNAEIKSFKKTQQRREMT